MLKIIALALAPLSDSISTKFFLAMANNLKSYEYFKYLLEEIPEHMDDKNTDFIKSLLSWTSELPEQIRK